MWLLSSIPVTVLLLPFVNAGGGDPAVTSLTCNNDRSVTIATTNADGYYISVLDCTDEATIVAGSTTISNCSLTWDLFTVQIYENQGIFTSSDYAYKMNCIPSTEDITATLNPTVTNSAAISTVTDYVEPTLTMTLTSDSAGNTPATYVSVGDTVYLNVDLSSDFTGSDGFDIRIKTVTATSFSGTTITLTGDSGDGDGCQSQTYWSTFSDLAQGSQQLQFSVFMFTEVDIPDIITFRATVEVCGSTACSAYTCSKRKKRDAENEIRQTTEVEAKLTIGAPRRQENKDSTSLDSPSGVNTQSADDMCVPKTTFYGFSIFFIVALAVSVIATGFMFYRTRQIGLRKAKHDLHGFNNSNMTVKSAPNY